MEMVNLGKQSNIQLDAASKEYTKCEDTNRLR